MLSCLNEVRLYHRADSYEFTAIYNFDTNKQTFYHSDELPDVVERLRGGTAAISQNGYSHPKRSLGNVLSLNANFLDLETHKTLYCDRTPDFVSGAIRRHCDELDVPQPTVINFSGRGFHVKWAYSDGASSDCLPQWNAVQRRLYNALCDFCPDRGAIDASRCLRLTGTINQKSNMEAFTVDYQSDRVWDLETMDFETIGFEPASLLSCQRTKKKVVSDGAQIAEARQNRVCPSNLWSAETLWLKRQAALRHLVALRGWVTVPVGMRNNFMFIMACAVSWGCRPCNLGEEIMAIAEEFTPSLPRQQVTALVRGTAERVRAANKYCLTDEYMIAQLSISPAEQRLLETIWGVDVRAEHKRAVDRERKRKNCDRDTYELQAAIRRTEALALRSQGLTYRQIASRMSTADHTVPERTVKSWDRLRQRSPRRPGMSIVPAPLYVLGYIAYSSIPWWFSLLPDKGSPLYLATTMSIGHGFADEVSAAAHR